jgi:hypothetical protein
MKKTERDDHRATSADVLERIVRKYEDMDSILFDPVTFPRSVSSNGLRRLTVEKRPMITGLHQNQVKVLPALAEDDETRTLRKEVSDLEHQSLDLSYNIQYLQQRITVLSSQISDLTNQEFSKIAIPPPPLLRKDRTGTPRGMQPTDMIAYYRQKYEDVKAKYEGLTKALSQQGRITRISMSNLRQITPPT